MRTSTRRSACDDLCLLASTQVTALPTLPKAAQLHGWRRTWFRFRQRKSAVVALVFVVFVALIGVLAPVLAPFDPAEQHITDRLPAPRAPIGSAQTISDATCFPV